MAAAKSPGLRVVAPNETPPPTVPAKRKTITEAATGGDRLELAIAMRDRIANACQDPKCPPRDLASLTKRLDDIADKIAVLVAAKKAEEAADDDSAEDDSFDATAI